MSRAGRVRPWSRERILLGDAPRWAPGAPILRSSFACTARAAGADSVAGVVALGAWSAFTPAVAPASLEEALWAQAKPEFFARVSRAALRAARVPGVAQAAPRPPVRQVRAPSAGAEAEAMA